MPRGASIQATNNETIQAYYKFMVDLVVKLGADRSTAEKQLLQSLEFEIGLAKVRKIFLHFNF